MSSSRNTSGDRVDRNECMALAITKIVHVTLEQGVNGRELYSSGLAWIIEAARNDLSPVWGL